MAGGIPAGRLSIEIVAEVARLQADMDKVKRLVRDASGDIAKNAKAANDNLAGIGRGAGAGLKQFSQEAQRANEYLRKIAQTSADVVTRVNAVTGVTGGMRRSADDFAAYGKELDRLRGQYNPLFAVIQKYRSSVDEIRRAHSVGAITTEEMNQAIRRERQASLESIAAIKGRTAATREAEQAAREAAKAEELASRQREAASASATSYASRLEAEAAAIGKTAAQLRAMEVEQRAAAAAAAGLGAEADRIRAAGAAYAEAAARAKQEADATRDAAAAHDAFEQRVREGVTALREREALVASADNYAAKLQAEAAAVGKTATELRDLEIAQRAANAAAEGMSDQADKIRAAGAALTEAEARARAYAEEQKRVADATKAAADAEAEYAKSIEDLKKQADPAGTAQAQLNTQMELAEKAFREGRLAADDYAKIIHNLQTRVNLLNTDGFGPLGHGGQVAGHHMLNLSFQMQDLGIQMLGAAQSSAPLKLAFTALAQQGSQIYGIIQQSGLGFKGFAVQALTAAGIIKVAGDQALIAAARQAAAHEAVVASLAERAVANAATAEAEVALARVQVANATTAGEAAAAHTRLAAAEARSAAAAAESATAQGALTTAQTSSAAAAQAASASMRTSLGAVSIALIPIVAAATAFASVVGLITAEINKSSKVTVTWSDTLLGAWDALAAALKGELSKAFDTFGVKTTDVWKTVFEWAKWAANRVIGLMTLVPRAILENFKLIPAGVADIFLSAVNMAIDAINKLISSATNGVNGFVSEANRILSKANLALPTLTTPQISKVANSFNGAAAKLGKGFAKTLGDTINRDFIGEIGDAISPYAQKRAIARGKKDAEKAGKAAGTAAAKAAKDAFDLEKFVNEATARMVLDVAELLAKRQDEDWAEFQKEVGNMAQARWDERMEDLAKEREHVAMLNDQYRDLINTLGNLGGVGAGLGTVFGLLTGNSSEIGGKFGNLLDIGLGTEINDQGEEIAKTIGTEVSKVFKKDGEFVKAFRPLLQGAGIGVVAGTALFGKQSAAEQTGSAIGGALGGSKVVEKTLSKGLESLSKGLGQFAGPLGSVLGGVLGSALGSAFTKVKWGRVDLSAAGVSGTSGNSGSSQKAALAAGNSIYGGLADLASQFGGSIGNFGNISVGVRHGDYRVNAGGTSLKVKKGAVDFNDDAEAAVAYAMKLAIERGAINGIRASTNNLLKAGDDLSAQINKALSFEGVFTELKTYLDPIGAELDTVEKEFANLRSIFAEAGATAAEYAQLEQLLSIKRQEAMNKEADALNDIRSRIAEAQGDEGTATAIARAKELRDATSDAQRALLQQLYALEDANAAQDKLTAAQEAAATAAEQLRQAWESTSDSLIDEVNRIRGLTGGDDAASFAALQGQFNAAVLAARGGDQEAAAKLADLSQSLLDVAGNVATSRQELERIKAETAASLEGVIDATKGYAGGSSASSASATAASAIDAATSATAGTSTSAADTDLAAEVRSLRAELAGLRSDNNAGHAQTASNTKAIQRKLEDVTEDGQGRAITVTSAAA